MLSAILHSRRRAGTNKGSSGKHRLGGVERLEDRRLLTAGPFFKGLGYLPGGDFFDSVAYGVSDDGKAVVGWNRGWNPVYDFYTRAFRWTLSDETMMSIGFLPGAEEHMYAFATSRDGSVIVGQSHAPRHSFRWSDGVLNQLPDQGFERKAYDVSADGTFVVGPTDSTLGQQAYVWQDGVGSIGLGDLPGGGFRSSARAVSNDGSTIVGDGTNANDQTEAFRWTPTLGMVGLGSTNFPSVAWDISPNGTVVVGRETINEVVIEECRGNGRNCTTTTVAETEAFRWTPLSGMEHLGDLPSGDHYSVAQAVSADGSLIAGSSSSSNGTEAFVWDHVNGMRSLQDVLVSEYGLDLTGWELVNVNDMTPDGTTLVGLGVNPAGNSEAFIARLNPAGAGISVSPASSFIQTGEDGSTANFTVVLDTQPVASVAIDVSSSNESEGTVVGATAGVLTLTFDATNWNILQAVTVQGVDDVDQDGDQPYGIQLAPAVSADPDYQDLDGPNVLANNVDDEAIHVIDVAIDETRCCGSVVVDGSYLDTHNSDDIYESITEETYGGNKRSRLSHEWTFNVTGGNAVTFFIEAHHNSSAEDFVFEYSTGGGWTELVTVTKTTDDDTVQSLSLPNTLSGPVLVQVRDTDRSNGENTADTIFVDHMYFESNGAGAALLSGSPAGGLNSRELVVSTAQSEMKRFHTALMAERSAEDEADAGVDVRSDPNHFESVAAYRLDRISLAMNMQARLRAIDELMSGYRGQLKNDGHRWEDLQLTAEALMQVLLQEENYDG